MDFISFIIILDFCSSLTYSLRIFNEKADDLIDKMLVNVYTARSRNNIPVRKPVIILNSQTIKVTTNRPRYVATKHKVINKQYNLTKEEVESRITKMKIKSILEEGNNPPPDFEKDELKIQTRRFDDIRNTTLKSSDNVLREIYFVEEYGPVARKHKGRTIRLMEQFIYETRYKLPYTQLLRKKYILQPRYRIGYCFALLANLKQQQMVLFSAMKKYLKAWQTLSIHLKMYEKIVRLDVDIRDVIAYIKKINWNRMQKEEPFYMEDVKHMQQ